MLRVRRRLKKLVLAGGMAACFVAGMATMYGLVARVPAGGESALAVVTVAVNKDRAATTDPLPQNEQVIELQARTHAEQRVARLRKAGDLYLEQEQDYAAALRCYTQALNDANPQTFDISPDDTWLEMALKDARRKEKARAN